MTILDKKEPTVSLKLVVAFVSIVTLAGSAGLFALNSAYAVAHHTAAPAPVESGNF